MQKGCIDLLYLCRIKFKLVIMFNIFKQDIKIGDRVKLYLTTGKEPEGIVVDIGNNFVLLQGDDKTQNRFFDKLIGGWDVIAKKAKNQTVSTKQIREENLQYINLEDVITFKCFKCNKEKTTKNFAIYDKDENKKICNACYGYILSKNRHNQLETPSNNSIIENDAILINKEAILNKITQLSDTLKDDVLYKSLEPNANIISVRGTTCIASNSQYPKILILNNTIIDTKLISEIGEFSVGSIIPIYTTFYIDRKNGEVRPTAVVCPDLVKNYLTIFKVFIENEKYIEAKRLSHILKNAIGRNKFLDSLISEFKSIRLETSIKKITVRNNENKDEKNVFKKIERKINELIRSSEFELAINKINEELENDQLDDKYKSSLLLKKAQAYSSLDSPSKSEKAYQELIVFNEKTGSPANNLSHLYTELARLQALNPEKQILALESVRKALKYNPNNNFANNLLSQFQDRSTIIKGKQIENDENNLFVDAEDDSTIISKMIDIDIREHKFINPDILKNAGKPTAFIAKQIFEIAKETRDIDLSERYPLYLEAAKAFSELNVGSYDLQDYLESVAYYAMLKGNSLFINFRNNVQSNKIDIKELTRLKDSACSYYMESLNLLSNIEPKLLLTILSNYLKLNIILYKLSHNETADFKGQFSNVFFDSIRSKDKELEQIAYQTIVSIGAASTQAWNKLSNINGGTGGLYNEFFNGSKRTRIYELINALENNTINTNISPSIFLKTCFQRRKQKEQIFEDTIVKITTISIEPHNISPLIERWNSLIEFSKLLSTTDLESKEKVDEILSILKPYLNRNQTERTNLLIQSKRIIESQLKFIANNTTFYGRTFFFPLLSKWEKEINILLEEKIAQSYPSLEIIIDPPYFVEADGEKIVNIIIKNNGETTTEGFELDIVVESTEYEENQQHFSFLSENEIPAGEQVSTDFIVPIELLKDSKAVEIEVNAKAIYQKKRIEAKSFQFTIEEEPRKGNRLTYDDIVWNEGQIPEKHLFIGRQQIINDLAQHYESVERHKPYILYGLTRTGKSSILKYLKDNLQGDIFTIRGKEMTLLPFSWDLSSAASFKKASDFWEYALYMQVYEELGTFGQLYNFDFSDLHFPERPRAKDFPILLNYLRTKNIYPFFLIDEFSFIKTLIDGDIINSAFLHTLRQYSLDVLASFIYAGTYDIKQLISDSKYGITGQLVNAIEEQINDIDDKYAIDLIEVMKDKLIFTPEAVSHIQTLSGNIPYFIQIICKYCGFYASENNRLYIGYPELEKVINILTGREKSRPNSLVKNLPENVFQNNQFSPADPKEVNVLISSIVYFNKEKINNPRGVGFDELQRLWAEKGVTAFRPKLADAINLLKDKKILIQEEDEGMPVYKFAVDLFRRWWAVHHSDIDLEITTII